MRKISIISLGLFFIVSCTIKHKNNRDYFLQYFDKNAEICAKILLSRNDIDSLKAIEYSKCMLNKLYDIDSSFIYMPSDSMTEYIIKNIPLLRKECGFLPSDSINK